MTRICWSSRKSSEREGTPLGLPAEGVLGCCNVVEDLSEVRVGGLFVVGGEHLTQRGVRALQSRGALRFAAQCGAAKQLRVGELLCGAVQRAEGRACVRDKQIGSRGEVGAFVEEGVGDERLVLPGTTSRVGAMYGDEHP